MKKIFHTSLGPHTSWQIGKSHVGKKKHKKRVEEVKRRDASKARRALEDRIRTVQSREDFDPYENSVDAMDKMLKEEVRDIEKMRSQLRAYTGDHPLLARYRQRLLGDPNWVPSTRERTLFFSVIKTRAGKGSLGSMGAQEYVRRMDDDDGFDDDEPDALTP